MKKLTNANNDVFGPFENIKKIGNGYLCDGVEYQFSVIGECSVSDWSGDIPDRRNPKYAAESIREDRDQKLIDSDWTQLLDVPVDQTAWAAYRQALRDIPQQDGFPFTVIWPEEP